MHKHKVLCRCPQSFPWRCADLGLGGLPPWSLHPCLQRGHWRKQQCCWSKHPCSFTSVKVPGKPPLERAELRCGSFSPASWEGRANNRALKPGKSCRIHWACWSWVRAGKASAGLTCLYWSYLKAFLEGTISGDSVESLLLMAEEHDREAALGCFSTTHCAFHCSEGRG